MDGENRQSNIWIDDDFSELAEPREWMDVPEKRLLFAILERAVRDALGNCPDEAEAAQDWIFHDSGKEPEHFSFRWICLVLDVDKARFLGNVTRLLAKKVMQTQTLRAEPLSAKVETITIAEVA